MNGDDERCICVRSLVNALSKWYKERWAFTVVPRVPRCSWGSIGQWGQDYSGKWRGYRSLWAYGGWTLRTHSSDRTEDKFTDTTQGSILISVSGPVMALMDFALVHDNID